MTFLPFTHTIYILITHQSKRGYFSKRKPQMGFYNTTHPPFRDRELLILQKEIIIASSPSLSHCHTLRGDLYPNTTHNYSQCRKCFGAWEALEIYQKKSVRLDGCNRAYCGIQIASEDKTPRSPLVVGAWRAQVHWVDQVWRVFCYSCTPTLFSSGSISTWCYLVFASLFPTL